MHKTRLALLLGGLAACAALVAEPGETHPCSAVVDAEERLACYDRAFGDRGAATRADSSATPAASSDGATPPAPATAAPAASASAARGEEEFGFTEAELRARDPERGRDEGPQRIEATVTAIEYLRTRERVITLDNGQVWRETEVLTRARLAVGDSVRIQDAALSSYRMVGPSGAGVRVQRLK